MSAGGLICRPRFDQLPRRTYLENDARLTTNLMKRTTLCLVSILCAIAVTLPLTVQSAKKGVSSIKKCQDASGHWHYGDTASAACAESKVTIINQQGVKTGVVDAPPTAAELREREKQQVKAEQAKEQQKRDELLLATYGREADITYVRDRKVAQLDSLIKSSQDTLKPLRAVLARLEAQAQTEQKTQNGVTAQTAKELERTRSQIGNQEAAIAERRREQAAIKAQAAKDLKRYRELKGLAPKETASTER